MSGQQLRFSIALLIFAFLASGVHAGEGQIDIASAPYTISSPGSYIVVADLTVSSLDVTAITIAANDVTLDLNGHTIKGPGRYVGGTSYGILVDDSPRYNISVSNGIIREWPSGGLKADSVSNGVFSKLLCLSIGGPGLSLGNYCLVTENNVSYCSGDGIIIMACSILKNNISTSNSAGITVTAGLSTIQYNTCSWNMNAGIGVSAAKNVVLNNNCIGNAYGLQITHATNYSSQNYLNGNTSGNESLGGSTEGAGDLANVVF